MSTSVNSAAPSPLARRLVALGDTLTCWKPYWSAHAFREPVLPWESLQPTLARALRSRDVDEIRRLVDDPAAVDTFLADWFPVSDWRALCEVDQAVLRVLAPWPRGMPRDVPGRKWDQITAFVAALDPLDATCVVDWCAGKAHLARALLAQQYGKRVTALERDPVLVEDARALAARDRLPLRAACVDVMSAEAPGFVDAGAELVALHACGALHRRLLDVAVSRGAAGIACAPCCFHLGPEGHRPRSHAGRFADPGLCRADLRTAVQEVVTAGGHARRRRERLQVWQLGFDALLRESLGVSGYTPAPAKGVTLAGDFHDFCEHAARFHGFSVPQGTDFPYWEQRGQARFREVSALDIVRQRFRRLIELWLVTDLGVSLEESGYAVVLNRFCSPEVSPRNLLLQARRGA